MATVQTSHEYRGFRTEAGGFMHGWMAEAVVGVAAVVLAIIGLANVDPVLLASITTIVVGAALVFAGAHMASRYCHSAMAGTDETEMGSMVSAEFMGGMAGVVLGILAVLGIVPETLVSIAVIVAGASLMVGSVAAARLGSTTHGFTATGETGHFSSHEGAFPVSGAQLLVGLAAVVLGIIALVGTVAADYTSTLNLVALLVMGGGLLFTGTTFSSRIMHALNR